MVISNIRTCTGMKNQFHFLFVGLIIILGLFSWFVLNDFQNQGFIGEGIEMCTIPASTPESLTVVSYFSTLFTTSNWPARWTCGEWSETEGWMYIGSDISIFISYFVISLMLLGNVFKLKLGKAMWIVLLFGAFILLCGLTHLIDAVIFWEPVYRLSGFTKLLTGVVSIGTTVVLVYILPMAPKYKSPEIIEKEVHLERISKMARIGNWELDLSTNRVTWSSMVYEIHEMAQGMQIELDRALDYYHPDSRGIISEAVEKCIKEGQPWDLELRIITVLGNKRWVRAIGAPIQNGDKIIKLAGLFQDIDERKRAQIKVQNSEKELIKKVEERTKLLKRANEELEAFSYSVSHDLRAPLRAINGYSEALMEDNKGEFNESALKYLNRISSNSQKMGALIDDLLEFSRMNRKQTSFVEVDMNQQINQLIQNYFIGSKEIIEVDELPKAYGDRELLDQVFMNLISNAIKYSSKEEEPKIRISAVEEGNHVILAINDNGVGFNMNYADKLFQVFQRLHSDSEFEGTGIGLALCERIISMHGGEIWAESEEGVGSTFYVKLKK